MTEKFKKLMIFSEQEENRIKEGIEKNRKGNFILQVSEGDKVHVKLKNHKFRFGCNLFMLDEIPDDEKKNELYKEKLKDAFNMATLPFYWDATEPSEGHTRYAKDSEKIYRRPPIDLCMEFCEKNGIEPREHALCYEHFFPQWMKRMTIEQVKGHIEKRMQQISERYADRIPTIEVTNEMDWREGVTDFYKAPDFMEWCYKTADKYFPNNELCINEWTGKVWETYAISRDPYYLETENVMLKGGRIDAVGMQYHMFFREEEYFDKTRKLYNIGQIFRILDNYSRLGKPIEITEVTIPAFTELAEDEETQAEILELLYAAWFSHPAVKQIIYWNLADGYAAFTTPGNMADGENYYRGGLLRFDMSEKPAYKRLCRLIKEEWTTDEDVEIKDGKACFRGFYGEYEVMVNGKTYIVNLDEDGKEAFV